MHDNKDHKTEVIQSSYRRFLLRYLPILFIFIPLMLGISVNAVRQAYRSYQRALFFHINPPGSPIVLSDEEIRDGTTASSAILVYPQALAFDPHGKILLADEHRIRRIGDDNIIRTVAGTGRPGMSRDDVPARRADLQAPSDIAVDDRGYIYIVVPSNGQIRCIRPDGRITTVGRSSMASIPSVGATDNGDHSRESRNRQAVRLNTPSGLTTDADNRLWIAGALYGRVFMIDNNGRIQTVVSEYSAPWQHPESLAVNAHGYLFVTDRGRHCIWRRTPDGSVTVAAGIPDSEGYSGDGGPATRARLLGPWGITVDSESSLYIADNGNHRIRKVSPDGTITTVAGRGNAGFQGDAGPAQMASLNRPQDVAIGSDGALYIVDTGNYRVRKVRSDGIIVTIAGVGEPDHEHLREKRMERLESLGGFLRWCFLRRVE